MRKLTAALTAAIALIGCAQVGSNTLDRPVSVSLCAVDFKKGAVLPAPGGSVPPCIETVDFSLGKITLSRADDLVHVQAKVEVESQANLRSFLDRSMHKQTVLSKDGQALLNLMIMSDESGELQLYLEPDETTRLLESLGRTPDGA